MKDDIINSLPNDIVAVLVTVSKDSSGNLVINPEEIAFGKYGNQNENFYCIDNSECYESLKSNLYKLEEGKQYYYFDRSIDELKYYYGEDLNNNNLMYHYMSDILDTYNVILKEDEKYKIHSIPLTNLKNTSDDPIEEITRPAITYNVVSDFKPKEFVKPNIITKDNVGNLSSYNLLDFEKYLKDRIIGNDRVLENIATTMIMNLTAKNPKLVENVLNIGPTGTGKTYTFQLIAEYMGVPIVIYNTSGLSTAGYTGENVNDLMKKVYDKANGNIELANKAIVVLDEIDKLQSKSKDLDIKEQAQDDLLALLGGGEVDVVLNSHTGSSCTLNTMGMTFVGNGAFTELFDSAVDNDHKRIGFFTPEQINQMEKDKEQKRLRTDIEDEDLIKYGLKRELVGRLPKRNIFANLDAEGLSRVLTEAKGSVLNLKKERYLDQFNTELICDDSFIDAIVEFALKEKLGGRSLNKVCSRIFERVDRQMLIDDHTEHKVLKLTRKNVENTDCFTFTK